MFFTTPGIFYTESLKTFVQNEMNTHIMYKVEYELFEQFNDPKSLCVEDLEYRKEKCFFDELEKYLIGKYNCSTPFTPKKISVQGDIVRFSPISKDNICTNQSIAIKVLSTYREWKKHEFKKSNCNKPCHNILMRDHTLVFPELLTDNVR